MPPPRHSTAAVSHTYWRGPRTRTLHGSRTHAAHHSRPGPRDRVHATGVRTRGLRAAGLRATAVHAAQVEVHAAPAVRARNSAAAPTASARTCARPPGPDVCHHPRGRRPKRCRSGRTGQPRTGRGQDKDPRGRGPWRRCGHDGDGHDGGNRDGHDGSGHGGGELEDVLAATTAVATLEATENSHPRAQGTGAWVDG